MEKLKVAIVGTGIWGETHASILSEYPMVELTAVCDVNLDKAKRFAAKFEIPQDRVYSNHQTMLRESYIDVVSIVTPDFLHKEICVDCANAGKNIICEKPLATTREDVEAIMEAVEANGIRLMVDLHNRFSPPFNVAKQSIIQGEIGEPYSAYFRLNDIKYVATTMLPWASQSSILWFLGSHSVDTLRWMFSSEVKRVYSVSRKSILAGMGVDTEDIFQTTLEFENGGIAQMENGWITPNTHPCINDIKFNITGTKGMISLDLSNNKMIERFTEDKHDHPDILVNHFVNGNAAGFAYQSIRYFIDRMIDGKPCMITPLDAANTSLVILSIIESAKLRQPVEVKYL